MTVADDEWAGRSAPADLVNGCSDGLTKPRIVRQIEIVIGAEIDHLAPAAFDAHSPPRSPGDTLPAQIPGRERIKLGIEPAQWIARCIGHANFANLRTASNSDFRTGCTDRREPRRNNSIFASALTPRNV